MVFFIHLVMNFASIVREARTSSGLSQAELATRAGVTTNTVWEMENQGSGTVAVLSKIIAALDLRFTGLPKGRSFADQIRTLRTRRGWTQERLALRAGCPCLPSVGWRAATPGSARFPLP